MKWKGWVGTGGEAKHLIQSGKVFVNGSIESRRGRRLRNGDQICFGFEKVLYQEVVNEGT